MNNTKLYFKNRFYFRGWSVLGLFNTAIAWLFNRVLIKHTDKHGKVTKWSVGIGTEFPGRKENVVQ
jgi:hypothetical protein